MLPKHVGCHSLTYWCPRRELNPHAYAPASKTGVSANSTTGAKETDTPGPTRGANSFMKHSWRSYLVCRVLNPVAGQGLEPWLIGYEPIVLPLHYPASLDPVSPGCLVFYL